MAGAEERPPFAFAGIWRRYRGRYRDGELVEIDTYSMVTTHPNPLVRDVHLDRMPFILHPADYEAWLLADPSDALALISPYPAELMQIVRKGFGDRADDVVPQHVENGFAGSVRKNYP